MAEQRFTTPLVEGGTKVKHDPAAIMCGCLACWRSDVADEAERKKKQEDAVIAEAFAIIQRRKESGNGTTKRN